MERQLENLLRQGGNMSAEQYAMLQQLAQQMGIQMPPKPVPVEEVEEEPSNGSPIDFQYVENDAFEKQLVKYLTSWDEKSAEDPGKVAKRMLELGFGNEDFDIYLRDVFQGKTIKSGLCRKLLKTNKDVGYQCLDCQKDPTCIICAGCFEKSNHKGHRIFLKQNVSGMCDCGDKEAWDEKGNCTDHTGFVEEDDVIPADKKSGLIKRIKQTLYFIIQAFEINNKAAKRIGASKLLIDCMDILMELCGLYPSLTPVVSKAITTPISFGKSPAILYHDPETFMGPNKMTSKPMECKCSALTLLLRYSQRPSPEAKLKLSKFLVSLFVDYDFKKTFAIEFINYFGFYFTMQTLKPQALNEVEDPKKYRSPISELAIQILTSEELALLAIKQSNFKQFLEIIIHILGKFIKNDVMQPPPHFIQFSLLQALEFCLMKRAGIIYFFSQPELINLYFQIFKIIQDTSIAYDRDLKADLTLIEEISENQVNAIEYLTSSQIDICAVILTAPKAERKLVAVNTLRSLKSLIVEAENRRKAVDSKEKRRFMFPLQRAFITFLMSYCYFDLSSDNKVVTTDFQIENLNDLSQEVFCDSAERTNFWRLMLGYCSEVSGFMREISRKHWNSFSNILLTMKDVYYKLDSFSLDVACLQFCNLELKHDEFFNIFFKDYLHLQNKKEWSKTLERLSRIEEVGQVMGDFFSMITEVTCNEIAVPNILAKITAFTRNMYGADSVNNTIPYTESMLYFLKQYFGALTPMPLKNFSKALERLVKDPNIIQDFMTMYVDVDKQTKFVKLKPGVSEKLLKEGIDFDLLWFDSREHSTFTQELGSKFPTADSLFIPPATSALNKRMIEKIYSEDTLEDMAKLAEDMKSFPGFEAVIRAFLKCLLLHLNAFKPGVDREEGLKKFFDGPLEKLLKYFEQEPKYATWAAAARSKIISLRRNYLRDNVIQDSKTNFESLAKMEEERKSRLLTLFNIKKQKIFDKIVARKKMFMIGLDKDSDKLVQSISKTNEDIQCPLTQEKLTNDKTYYILCQSHHSNLTRFAKVCTLNSMLNDSEVKLAQEEYDQITNLRDQALRDCQRLGAMILTSCRHAVSKDSLVRMDNNTQVYAQDEVPCPLCKAPSNVNLPHYRREVYQILSTVGDATIADIHKSTLVDLVNYLRVWFKNEKIAEGLFKENASNSQLMALLEEEKPTIETLSSNIVSGFCVYTDLYEKASTGLGGKKRGLRLKSYPSMEVLILKSLGEIIKFVELYGLANTVKDYSKIYHNLYLSLRLSHLSENMSENALDATNPEGQSKRIVIATRIASSIILCDESNENFIYTDIDKVLTSLLVESVEYELTVVLPLSE